MATDKKTEKLLLICFLFSGAAGLIYEVVWSRQLNLFVGITTYAHTAVITAYMLGLALGSWWFGRWSDRHPSPLRLYAGMEVAIALYAAATPWIAAWLQLFYAGMAPVVGITGLPSHLLRFFFVLLLLLPPTFLMGGTLPVMVRAMTVDLAGLTFSAGRLYGINTLGAVLGTVAAGYLLIPTLGMRFTLFVGAALDMFVAVAVFGLSWRVDTTSVRQRRQHQSGEKNQRVTATTSFRWIPVLFAGSGFAALAYQIAWIRALTLVLGSSVYSFTAVVATFLTGIGLGSLVYRCLPGGGDRNRQVAQAAIITIATGFSAALGLLPISRLPDLFLWGFQQGWSAFFPVFQLFAFVLCFLVMIVPTFLLGTMFPLMATLWTRQSDSVGRDVGEIYAANTVGCIAGALVAGLLFLPWIGVPGTLLVAAGIHIAVGIGFSLHHGSQMARVMPVGVMVVFGLLVFFLPAWDRAIMTSGVYTYAQKMGDGSPRTLLERRMRSYEMLYYKDGLDGTVSVLEDARQRMLVINGKIDASSVGDLPTQVMIGQLPMVMHPNPKHVLVIGLGSGITAGSIAAHDSVETIDILEISPEVVAASAYFSEQNRRILDDPRVNVIVADARNFLLGTKRRYDVIVAQPSNPWISGISNLFTYDFFEIMRSRLAAGGIVSQWFHMYNMSPVDTRSVLHAFGLAFPSVSAWLSIGSDLIMIGSEQSHVVDAGRLLALMDDADLRRQFEQVGKNGVGLVAEMFLFRDEAMVSYGGGSQLNTDDRPLVEFHAPRYLYRMTEDTTLSEIIDHTAIFPSDVPVNGLVNVKGTSLHLPALGLVVTVTNPLEAQTWNAGYHVGRQILPGNPGKVSELASGSQAWVTWRDGRVTNELVAVHLGAEPSLKDLMLYITSDVHNTPISSGEVDIPGGQRGVWHLSQAQGSSTFLLDVAWSVAAPHGGYLQVVGTQNLPQLSRDEIGPTLVRFVRSFQPELRD